MKRILTIGLLASVAFAGEGYKVINKIKIGGTGGWDYLTVDPVNRRVYVSHGTSVEVVDPDAGKVVGSIKDLHGVHGIAVAPDLNRGFITNGQSNSVTVFDLKTLAKVGEPATGKNPDAVCYDLKSKRAFTMNHSGNDATAIDAKTNEVLTFQIGSPEFCAVDGAGRFTSTWKPPTRSWRLTRRGGGARARNGSLRGPMEFDRREERSCSRSAGTR